VGTLFRLWRWSSVATAIVISAAVLGCAGAIAPMFLTSAGSEIFRQNATRLQSAEAFQMRDFGLFVHEFADYRDELLVENLPEGLTPPISTAWGEIVSVTAPGGEQSVRAVTRTGALDNVELLTDAPKSGLWLSDFIADAMQVEAGDTITVGDLENSVDMKVTGIYRDVVKDPITDFWAPLGDIVFPRPGDDTRPPAPLLLDRATFFDLTGNFSDDSGEYRWEFSLEETDLTLDEVRSLNARVNAFNAERLDSSTQLGSAFNRANSVSLVAGWVELTEGVVSSVSGPVQTLALSGTIVAGIIIAGTALFTVLRRQTEFKLLHARGVSPLRLGIRSATEALLPLAIGATLGWVLAVVFVRTVGPPGLIDESALRSGVVEVAWRTAAALFLFGLGTTLAVRVLAHESFGRIKRVAQLPWELIVLALAGAAFYELSNKGATPVESAGEIPAIDGLVILFPILFVVGMAGLAARGFRRLLPRLRTIGSGWPAALYLASRRLSAAARSTATLITVAAIAVGILCYASTLSLSSEATANQQAFVQVGSEVSASVSQLPSAVDTTEFDSTPVIRILEAELEPAGTPVDVLAVDPNTFAAAAFWDDAFSDQSLDELLTSLDSDVEEGIPTVTAGNVGEGRLLSLTSYDVPVTIAGTANRWPGMIGERPVVVVATENLEAEIDSAGGSLPGVADDFEVWSNGTKADLEAALEDEGQSAFGFLTAGELRDTPAYLALSWTLGLMRALGLLIGAVALLGTLLYVQTRQKERVVSYALSRRMGLRRGSHRTAVAIELASMLSVALVTGIALSLFAAIAMHDRVELLADRGSVPVLRIPITLMLLVAVTLLAFAGICSWLVQRAADRADVAQVMRLAR
jgi:putative ABC transport system permease protein